MTKNMILFPARMAYFNGGTEKPAETASDTTPPPDTTTGTPDDVNSTKEQANAMIGHAVDAPTELSEKDPTVLYNQCLEADKLFLKAVDRNLYAGKEEEAEGKLIKAGEQVPVVKPGVDKYKSAYKAPDKPNVPTPNVLVEYMANAVYKNINTSFTDANGSTNDSRGDKLYNYIFGSDNEQKQSENAKKVAKWFNDAKKAIEKGIA